MIPLSSKVSLWFFPKDCSSQHVWNRKTPVLHGRRTTIFLPHNGKSIKPWLMFGSVSHKFVQELMLHKMAGCQLSWNTAPGASFWNTGFLPLAAKNWQHEEWRPRNTHPVSFVCYQTQLKIQPEIWSQCQLQVTIIHFRVYTLLATLLQHKEH